MCTLGCTRYAESGKVVSYVLLCSASKTTPSRTKIFVIIKLSKVRRGEKNLPSKNGKKIYNPLILMGKKYIILTVSTIPKLLEDDTVITLY